MEPKLAMEAPLDVEAAIGEFLRDPARTSLELPPMAPGQRKRAKAMADQHPNVVCESFGLGTERCLHLFKTGPQAAAQGAGGVSVKNTFIDDWIATADDEDAPEPVVFRSMPPMLPRASVQSPTRPPPSSISTIGGKLDLSPINEGSPKWPREACAVNAMPLAADSCKAAAAKGNWIDTSLEGAKPGELPTLLDNFQVRNTFIHIDCMPPDERSVQSMPHDMFRQCLKEEAQRHTEFGAAASTHPATVPTSVPNVVPAQLGGLCGHPAMELFPPGTQVIIGGLMKLPSFNGQLGVVESLDEVTGRYSVRLAAAASGAGGPQRAKVRAENLRLAAAMPPPPPPSFTPLVGHLATEPPAYQGTLVGAGACVGALGGLPLQTTPLWDDAFGGSPLRLATLV